ncbi:hypothetical protein SynBIOSE41_02981 [Synechococcus sp. BIOS-E4-1]|nr:hypothetical protein SynBIOSE41_02981 [Synechococcus sp. BIOS-E4-1]
MGTIKMQQSRSPSVRELCDDQRKHGRAGCRITMVQRLMGL